MKYPSRNDGHQRDRLPSAASFAAAKPTVAEYESALGEEFSATRRSGAGGGRALWRSAPISLQASNPITGSRPPARACSRSSFWLLVRGRMLRFALLGLLARTEIRLRTEQAFDGFEVTIVSHISSSHLAGSPCSPSHSRRSSNKAWPNRCGRSGCDRTTALLRTGCAYRHLGDESLH